MSAEFGKDGFSAKTMLRCRLDPQGDERLGTITFTISNLPGFIADAVMAAGRDALRDIVISESKNVGSEVLGVRELPARASKSES